MSRGKSGTRRANARECPRMPRECPPKMTANAPRMPTRANNNLCFLPLIFASSGSLGSSPHPKAEHGDGADRGGRFADPRPFVSASTPLSYDRCVGDRGGRLADPRPFVSASIALSSDRCVGRSVERSYIGFATTYARGSGNVYSRKMCSDVASLQSEKSSDINFPH